MLPPPPRSTLFPYTTLFRSCRAANATERAKWVASNPERARILDREYHARNRSEEHTSELQSLRHLVCRLLLEKKKAQKISTAASTQTDRKMSTSICY